MGDLALAVNSMSRLEGLRPTWVMLGRTNITPGKTQDGQWIGIAGQGQSLARPGKAVVGVFGTAIRQNNGQPGDLESLGLVQLK